jgi:hypothetical protein
MQPESSRDQLLLGLADEAHRPFSVTEGFTRLKLQRPTENQADLPSDRGL